jgi:hypothetical protein
MRSPVTDFLACDLGQVTTCTHLIRGGFLETRAWLFKRNYVTILTVNYLGAKSMDLTEGFICQVSDLYAKLVIKFCSKEILSQIYLGVISFS